MLLGLLSALTVAQTQPQHACHNGTRVLKSAGTSSCPDSSRWLQKVSRHWIGQETARFPEGNYNGCKVGKSWVKGGCHVTKPIVFLNIGANKGFAVAQMMQQFTLKPGFNNQDWLTAMGDYLMETYGVKQESLANFLPDYCGACRACKDHVTLMPNVTRSMELDVHAFEIAQPNARWLRWVFARFGIHASVVRAAATNETGRVKIPYGEGIADFGDERSAVRSTGASMKQHGKNADCPNCRQFRCYEEGTCWNYLSGIALDDYIGQEGLHRIHLLSIDTEGHDALVLEGLRNSLSKGVVDVIEFEFNVQLGSWNPRSTQRRTLHSMVLMLEANGYGCFWQSGDGCISPVSGECWKGSFERVGWSNLVCGRGKRVKEGASKNKKSTVLRAAAGGRGSNPLADLWELADECGKLPDPV